MWEKAKFLLVIALFFGVVLLSYKMGELSRPIVSFDSNYETIQSLAHSNFLDSFDVKDKANLSYSYIPAYSHIYASDGNPVEMAITLSLRNIDAENAVFIEQILYFNTEGTLLRRYLKQGLKLSPLQTKEIFIKNKDVEGGSGANFVVLYSNERPALTPIFEAVMVGDSQGRSYTFSSRGISYRNLKRSIAR